MARGFVHKDSITLAWLDNRDQVKLDIRKIVRRLENEVIDRLQTEFDASLARGELFELRPGEASLTRLLSAEAEKLALQAGTDTEDSNETS